MARHGLMLWIAITIGASVATISFAEYALPIAAGAFPGAGGDFPSWVQAVSCVILIPMSVFLAYWGFEETKRKEADAKEAERRERVRGLACMLAAELLGLKNRVQLSGIIEAYRGLGEKLLTSDFKDLSRVFTARSNVTVIYDTAGYRIGDLGSDLAERVVTLYVEVKSVMETMNNFAESYLRDGEDDVRFALTATVNGAWALEIAEQCSQLSEIGDDVISELQALARA